MQKHGFSDIGKRKGETNSFHTKKNENDFVTGLLHFTLTDGLPGSQPGNSSVFTPFSRRINFQPARQRNKAQR